MTIIIIMPSYDPTLFFPVTLDEIMVGTTANTSTSTMPVGTGEIMGGTVSNTATIPFPITVSD